MSKASTAFLEVEADLGQPDLHRVSLQQVAAFFSSEHAPLDAQVLFRNWGTAARTGALPLYEEVVLGRIGRAGAHIALVRALSDGGFEIAHAGSVFEQWIETSAKGLDVAALPPDSVRAFREALTTATELSVPVHSVAHAVRQGYVSAYDLVIFPLANRWGLPLLLAYVNERANRYSLIDAMFASTSNGMLALAPVRGSDGMVQDFQVVSLNQGAATLVGQPLDKVRWQRLSELFPDLSANHVIPRLIEVLQSNSSSQFELAYPGSRARSRIFRSALRQWANSLPPP